MTNNSYKRAFVGVVGAGAWGTALAVAAHRAGSRTLIWGRNRTVISQINNGARNEARLPDCALPGEIKATSELAGLGDCDLLVLAVPAQQMRAACRAIASEIAPEIPAIICAKGIEHNSGAMMSAVVGEEMPQASLCVLSGPSFARDVAMGLPTAVTLAAKAPDIARQVSAALASRTFRLYLNDDMIGVEIGGAAKNVLAIACGIVAGKDLGASAGAALTTRGFAELSRLGAALGGRPETLGGLSGLGDLILTCSSLQSRNMAFGHALGRGATVEDALTSVGAAVEGVHTAQALCALAARLNVDMPIANAVAEIVSGRLSIDGAIENLLARPQRAETE